MERDQAHARLNELNDQHAKNEQAARSALALSERTTTLEEREEVMRLCSNWGLEVPRWARHWTGPFE